MYAKRESQFTGKPWALWSDGRVTKGETHGPVTTTTPAPSEAAVELLGAAIRQKEWTGEDRRWRELLTVAEVTSRVTLDERENRRYRSGEAATLEALTVRHTDGRTETYYLATLTGWAMGEDGDVWTDVNVYDDEGEARRAVAEWMRS
ncbi:MAG: hypothetical protein HY332_20910 [Chloroflexi bacterium]|nr:hypothetical protein [Chloroflexota bacterium]